MRINFFKYHGAGNDFILIKDLRQKFPREDVDLISGLCDRHKGIGADGLILLQNSRHADFSMLYFNSDGQLGTMCGNGGRCILAFARDSRIIRGEGPFVFEASDGLHTAAFSGKNRVLLKMQDVDKIEEKLGGYRVDTGSMHHVEYVDKLVDMDIEARGRAIRSDPAYAEDGGTNVNFVLSQEEGTIAIRTYERGVEAETLACGTGAVAAALVQHKRGCPLTCYSIKARGGELSVDFRFENGSYSEIYLEGPVQFVFRGLIGI